MLLNLDQVNRQQQKLEGKYARIQRPNAGINSNPNVVEAPQIDLPAGYGERQESAPTRPQGPTMRTGPRDANQRMDQFMMTKIGMDPRTQKGRRRGYGTGAALAAALGVSYYEKRGGSLMKYTSEALIQGIKTKRRQKKHQKLL